MSIVQERLDALATLTLKNGSHMTAAENRLATMRAERDELLAFARRVAGSAAYEEQAGRRLSQAESAEAELAALRASERVMWMSPQGHLAPLPRGRNWRRVVVSVRDD